MDEDEIIKLHDDSFDVNSEVIYEDDEIEFQFLIDDEEYDEVMKKLKNSSNVDSDPEYYYEDCEEQISLCPYENCKKKFTKKQNLEKHLERHNSSETDKVASVCHICGKLIKGLYSLHIKTHEDQKRFRCDDCGKEFRQKVTLNNHVLIHKNQKPFACPQCQKKFRQKYTMQSHIKSFHFIQKNHTCGFCTKDFANVATLNKHLLIHTTNRPHHCLECSMSFRHKSSLSRHCKTHMKLTKCQLCDKSFRFDSFLKKHMTTSHGFGNEDQITVIMEVMKDEVKDEFQKPIIVYTQESTSNVLNFDSQMTQHQRIFDQSQDRIQQPEC